MNIDDAARSLKVRQFKKPLEYSACWQSMKHFTETRQSDSLDEVWLLEHKPVFTQGIRESAKDLIDSGDIPVVKTDRGGLITYHGPGQLLIYLMVDLRRLEAGLKYLVNILEQSTIDVLGEHGIQAARKENAPGVYVDGSKIASLGLRVQRGCTYHGLSLNVDMDLSPFDRIVPCGLTGINMTDMKSLGVAAEIDAIGRRFVQVLSKTLRYNRVFDDLGESSRDDSE
jgi:lipoyl(octanoyl) transferase